MVMELTFDPNVVSEVIISRVLTFLYTGEVELNKDSEGLEETLKISELLNISHLWAACQNVSNGRKIWLGVCAQRSVEVAKLLFLNKVCVCVYNCMCVLCGVCLCDGDYARHTHSHPHSHCFRT